MNRKLLLVSPIVAVALFACGQSAVAPSQPGAVAAPNATADVFWTREEISKVNDLSELGRFHMVGSKVYLGEKQIRPEDTEGKFYSIATAQPLQPQDGGYMSGNSSAVAAVNNCINSPTGWLGTATITGRSSTATTTSLKATYMAVDGKLYRRQYGADAGIYDQKYAQTTNGYPTSGVSVTTTGTENCAAIVTGGTGYQERGWHKGIFPIRDLAGNSTTTLYGTSQS